MKVNLWFARDEQNKIISIIDSNNENTYTCPICASKVIPKALESKKITPHYAHVDVDKCNSESMLHWWFKHKFIERGDTFKIKTDNEIEYTCEDFDTEVTFQLDSGTYRPDLVIYTECGQEIVFEMANTNKKKVQDYIDKWIELDRIVVEVDIKALQNVDEIKVFNALYYKGKCFNFNKRDGGYYNTIGKLKEQMKQNGKYDIELIKKLDWFWNEISNIDNIDSKTAFDKYHSIKKSLRQKIIDIVKISKCSNYFNKIFRYESSIMYEEFESVVPFELMGFFDYGLIIRDYNKSVDANYGGILINCTFLNDRDKVFNSSKKIELKEYLTNCINTIITSREYRVHKFIECNSVFTNALNTINRGVFNINPNVKIYLSESLKKEDMSGLVVEFTDLGFYYNIPLDEELLNIKTECDTYDYLESKIKHLTSILPSDDENKELFNEIINKYSDVDFNIVAMYSNMIIFKHEIYTYLLASGMLYKFNSFYSDTTFNNIEYLNNALKNKSIVAKNNVEIKVFIEDLVSRKIICKGCKKIFKFTYDESKYFKLKELTTPKRCKDCRQKRKLERNGNN